MTTHTWYQRVSGSGGLKQKENRRCSGIIKCGQLPEGSLEMTCNLEGGERRAETVKILHKYTSGLIQEAEVNATDILHVCLLAIEVYCGVSS